MTSNITVIPLRQPDAVNDPLTAVLRDGARRLLAQAVEAEAEAFTDGQEGTPFVAHQGREIDGFAQHPAGLTLRQIADHPGPAAPAGAPSCSCSGR